MSRRHGRAVIPFGKYKGVRIRLLPDDYLSFLTTTNLIRAAQWRWLKDSVIAELRFRGFREDLALTLEQETAMPVPSMPLDARREISLDAHEGLQSGHEKLTGMHTKVVKEGR